MLTTIERRSVGFRSEHLLYPARPVQQRENVYHHSDSFKERQNGYQIN
jgi:hypothetical protein